MFVEVHALEKRNGEVKDLRFSAPLLALLPVVSLSPFADFVFWRGYHH